MFGLTTVTIGTAAVMGVMSGPVDYDRLPKNPTLAVIVVDAYKRVVGSVFDRLGQVLEGQREIADRMAGIERRISASSETGGENPPASLARPEPRRIPFKDLVDQATVEPMLSKSLARIRSGKASYKDVITVVASYNTTGNRAALDRFCSDIQDDRHGIEYPQGFSPWLRGQCAREAR